MPDLHNPEVAKAINENELDLRAVRGLLATDEKAFGGLFLQYLMSYPRWVNAKGEIEIGGEDYFAILAEAAEAERKAVDDGKPPRIADTGHIATISDRAHKRMESLAAVPPERLHKAFAKQERMKRGGIDETTTKFINFVNIVGHKTGCNAAASVVIGAIKRLLELLGTCNGEDFNKLDTTCNAAEDALLSFGLALAKRQDNATKEKINAANAPQTPVRDDFPTAPHPDNTQYTNPTYTEYHGTGRYIGQTIETCKNWIVIKGKEDITYTFVKSTIPLMNALINAFIGQGDREGWVDVPYRANGKVKIKWRQNLKDYPDTLRLIESREPGKSQRDYTGRVRLNLKEFPNHKKSAGQKSTR